MTNMHLTLDRRDFMEKLIRFTGSAAAAAIAPLIAVDSARAAIVGPDDKRISGEDVTFPGSKGKLSGYLAMPANAQGKLPGVIVIHEDHGLNPHIEDIARRLATEGFLALAPDFLSALGGTPADQNKVHNLFTKLTPEKVTADALAATEHLRHDARTNGKVGVVGFSWGGGVANQLAVNDAKLLAAVVYYGMQPFADDVKMIKAKLMLHYAGLDDSTNAGIDPFEKALRAADVEFQVYIYDGVYQSFNNDTVAARYNRPAADLAWSRTVAFLKECLA